ncbi:unnamed protein product [Closterium sp. NIES-65]|nr:unnamed protein product [Closterium sp. NIES-65]
MHLSPYLLSPFPFGHPTTFPTPSSLYSLSAIRTCAILLCPMSTLASFSLSPGSIGYADRSFLPSASLDLFFPSPIPSFSFPPPPPPHPPPPPSLPSPPPSLPSPPPSLPSPPPSLPSPPPHNPPPLFHPSSSLSPFYSLRSSSLPSFSPPPSPSCFHPCLRSR